jgi:hypothetical protein
MDDFSVLNLHESKNEWSARLVDTLTPLVIEGFISIFKESMKLCEDNNEEDKYLMTFQNFLSRVPKWNPTIIDEECKRVVEQSACDYLEDLITCVHIIQLKIMTCMRVGQKQKKIDINIPKLNDFIHKVYINVARKLYTNVYLFETEIEPLQIQKHNRELEIIVKECIFETIRDNIPVNAILKAYLDETEEEVEEVRTEEILPVPEEKPVPPPPIPVSSSASASSSIPDNCDTNTTSTASSNAYSNITSATENSITNNNIPSNTVVSSVSIPKLSTSPDIIKIPDSLKLPITNSPPVSPTRISFNDVDHAINEKKQQESIHAPKTIERLEQISEIRNEQRKQEEDDDDEDDKIQIHDGQNVVLDIQGINEITDFTKGLSSKKPMNSAVKVL